MEVLKSLLRSWWIIILAVGITTGSTVYIGMQQPKIYQANSTVEIGPSLTLEENQIINIINVLTNRRTSINTYARKATSGTIKERVAARLGVPQSVVNRAGIIATVLPETTLIEIRARATDPKLAAAISDAVAQELVRQAPDTVMMIEIIDYANPVSDPIEPQASRLLTMGVITGGALGIGFALAIYIVERFVLKPAVKPVAAKGNSADAPLPNPTAD
jgi:uncharacterized protein involved in exopolysaccharide biosynthesis